jgi:glycerol-3-phosphate dehydrogenase
MKRDLAALTATPFDVLVVGGGVVGACVAWDAALRGLSVALIDKGDFASGTSSNSLKVLHGGLRYLQHLDLHRMRESIRERATWLRIAPHLCHPLPILVPTYRRGLQTRLLLRTATAISDALAWDRNDGLFPERRLPPARAVSRKECLDLVPELERPDLTGGVVFHDAQMYSSERLVLDVVRAAVRAGAIAANYVEFEGSVLERGRIAGGSVRDGMSGDRFTVRARSVVNATGAWIPMVAGRSIGRPGAAAMHYSVAVNLMLPSLGHRVAFAIPGGYQEPNAVMRFGRRQLFIVPWRERSLVGTGHYPYGGDPARFEPPEADVARFLDEVNSAWPQPSFRIEDIVLVHAGLLPAEAGGSSAGVRLVKHARVVDHSADGLPGFVSAVSVKFTTARSLAERVVDHVFTLLTRRPPPCRTAVTPLPGAPTCSPDELAATARRRYGDLLDADVLEHLVRAHGVEYEGVLSHRDWMPDWSQRVEPSSPVISAQFVHGCREEMAVRAEDLVNRRTELGARGQMSPAALRSASVVLDAERHGPRAPLDGRGAPPGLILSS